MSTLDHQSFESGSVVIVGVGLACKDSIILILLGCLEFVFSGGNSGNEQIKFSNGIIEIGGVVSNILSEGRKFGSSDGSVECALGIIGSSFSIGPGGLGESTWGLECTTNCDGGIGSG